jgi:SAM-dependent MidA family methyltransferase
MEAALYGPDGFYEREGGGAGRRGDFLTAPEVGPLFGAVVARGLDAWWDEQGRPDGFTAYDVGAGAGTLGRSLALAGSAHRYVAVDRSATQRARHDGLESAAALPDGELVGVVVANELLDNLPFDLTRDGEPFDPAQDWPETGLAPQQDQARRWVDGVLARLRGRLVVLDYASTTAAMAGRPWKDWLRTYRGHDRGGHPMDHLGRQDITAEVAVDQLPAPGEDRSQAEWLRGWGIDELVEEGRRIWRARAHLGDLEAIRARSRVNEAEALLDPAGMGSFRVLEWSVPHSAPNKGDSP